MEDSEGELLYHPIHKEWLDSVNASATSFRKESYSGLFGNSFLEWFKGSLNKLDSNADVYVFENPIALLGAGEIHRENPDSKMVYLETNWKMYGLDPYNLDKENVRNRLRALDALIKSFAIRREVKKYIDSFITVSPMMEENLNSLFPNKPVEIIRPVPNQKITVQPDLESNNAIFVGKGRDYKGADILVNAWKKVRENFPDAELFLVGEGHNLKYEGVDGIHILGYVQDLDDVYKNVSLYVHPARMDASPVSTIEAIFAGFPAIVTNQTGTKSEISDISESMIVDPDSEKLALAINNYFSRDLKERKTLSKRAGETGKQFFQKHSDESFKQVLQSCLGKMY